MRFIYTTVFYCSIPFILLRLFWRSFKAPAYRQRWLERFGFGKQLTDCQIIWIHAVSVGEVQAAIPLIQALQNQYSHHSILVTTMTPTGSQRVKAVFGEQIFHTYLPYDLPDAIARFLRRIRPKLLILMETELWPNLLYACQQRKIPILLANARLSERSALGYQRIRRLIDPALCCINHIAAQTQADADRFVALGYPKNKITVIGSIKFDMSLPIDIVEQGHSLRQNWGKERIVWIAASMHEGEEEIILSCLHSLKQQIPTILLVLVPRHPERFNRVAQLCQQFDFKTVRRSTGQHYDATIDVYLGDTMGELLLLYAASDVAYVGGSLVPIGGHNLLEPAVLGLPVIIGPYTFDFTLISEKLLAMNAARRVHHQDELKEAVLFYCTQSVERTEAGLRGQAYVKQNQGALQRLLHIIEKWLL